MNQDYGNPPKVFAHRGASADFPEHTLAAYLAAIEQRADGFECDIRLTKDGIPVLWHDSTLNRMAKVSGKIAHLTFQEIQNRYPSLLGLNEFLELAIAHKKDLAIETKHPVPSGREIERTLLQYLENKKEKIKESGIEISLMSFSWFAISSAQKLEINTVALFDGASSGAIRRFTSAKTLGPSIETIKKRPEIISKARKQGKRLFIWTVDEPSDFEYCQKNGIDVVITNKPALARKVLGYP